MSDQYELLVGDRWLQQVGAVIDYPNSLVNLTQHRIKLHAVPVQCSYQTSFKKLALISLKEVKRLLKKRKPMFLVKLSLQDEQSQQSATSKLADEILQKLLQ